MEAWKSIKESAIAIAMMHLLVGRKLKGADGTDLGTITDVQLDTCSNRLWAVVNSDGRWISVPITE